MDSNSLTLLPIIVLETILAKYISQKFCNVFYGVRQMILDRFRGEGPLRRILEERMKKGPALKKLREQFFKAATKVFDADQFYVSLRDDLGKAKSYVVIISPFLHMDKVQKFVSTKEVRDALDRGVSIIVVTRPPEQDQVGNVYWHRKCIELLEGSKIKVVTVKEPKLHFKAVIIDDEIIYIGSINPLSIITVRETPSDYMIRFESEALVDEIVENAIGRKTYEEWLRS